MTTSAGLPRAGREPRLDPVRWRRPGAGTLIRLCAVAVLLSLAALIAWSGSPAGDPVHSGPPCAAAPRVVAAGSSGAVSPSPNARDPASTPAGARAPASAVSAGDTSSAGDPASAARTRDPASASGDGGVRVPAVPPGDVGVPVRLADPTGLALVRPGDRADLLRLGDAGEGATPVASSALVLGVTGLDEPVGGLLVALRPADAEKVVATQGHGFAILIRPP